MILKNNKRIDGVSLDTTPIGALFAFTGLTAPNGYLLCQGQLVSKTRYAALYAICGDTFGTSTSTEFYLPDLRGKTITGYKEGDSTFGTLGALIGALTHVHTTGNHTLTEAEMPTHGHTFYATPNSHTSTWVEGVQRFYYDVNTTSESQTYSASTLNTGGSGAHNHGDTGSGSSLQPSLNLNWIIKAEMINYTTSQVYDGLDSTSSIDSLSAKQGKVLNDKFANYVLSSSLSAVATSGSYNDLSNKPSIPTKTSDLTNDSNFVDEDDIYYKSGDTLTFADNISICVGLVTNSTKNVDFTIITPKKLKNISSITANSIQAEIRGISGYLNSTSGFNEYVGTSGYTISTAVVTDNMFRVVIAKSSAWTNTTNNTPITINFNTSSSFTFN